MVRFVASLLLLGFASDAPAADPYDTGSELSSRYGYLVIDTVVGRPATKWQLDENLTIGNLPLGRRTILIRLRVGDYQWQQIDVPYFDLPHRLDLSGDRRWAFTIHKRKINYAGTLIINETRGSDSVGVRFVNRSSEVVELLTQNYSEHLRDLGIMYSGSARDDFLTLSLGDDASENSDQASLYPDSR